MPDKIIKIEIDETHIAIDGKQRGFDIDLPRYILLEYLDVHELTLSATDRRKANQLVQAVKQLLKGQAVELETLGIQGLKDEIEPILAEGLKKEIGGQLIGKSNYLLEGMYAHSPLVNKVLKEVLQDEFGNDMDKQDNTQKSEWVLKLDTEEWRWPVSNDKVSCHGVKLVNRIGRKRLELYLCEGCYSQLILKDWWHIKKEDPLIVELMLHIGEINQATIRAVSYFGRHILFETN